MNPYDPPKIEDQTRVQVDWENSLANPYIGMPVAVAICGCLALLLALSFHALQR